MSKIICPLWAPLILEEVEFTVWGTNWDSRGSGRVKKLVRTFLQKIYIQI